MKRQLTCNASFHGLSLSVAHQRHVSRALSASQKRTRSELQRSGRPNVRLGTTNIHRWLVSAGIGPVRLGSIPSLSRRHASFGHNPGVLGSVGLGSITLGLARLGSATLGSARLWSARLGSAHGLKFAGPAFTGSRHSTGRQE